MLKNTERRRYGPRMARICERRGSGRIGRRLAVGDLPLMEVNYTLAQIHTENKECRQCLLTTILPVPYPE